MTHVLDANHIRLSLDVSEESHARPVKQGGQDDESNQEPTGGGAGSGDGSSSDQEPTVIGSDEPEPLPKDVAFDILKNSRRRLVLQYAFEHENPVTIGTLAEHVAAIENDKDVAALNSRERKRAYVGLYQCHLPRMHDAGVIDFDQNRGTVSLGAHAKELIQHLDTDSDEIGAHPWLYAALATVGTGAYLISQSALVGASSIGTGIVGVVLVAFLIVSLWQLFATELAADDDEAREFRRQLPVFDTFRSSGD